MGGPMIEFIVAQGERHGQIVTRLINVEVFNSDGLELADYFEGSFTDVNEVGRVQVMGDMDEMDDLYISE